MIPKNTKETRSEYFTAFREPGKPPKLGLAAQVEHLLSAKEKVKAL